MLLPLLLLLSTPTPAQPSVKTQAIAVSPPYTWVTADDYPAAALRANLSGTVGMRLFIDATGIVVGCTVEQSAGSDLLDQTACNLVRMNGRYQPARDAAGRPVPDQKTLHFTWQIPSVEDARAANPAAAFLPPMRPFAMVLELDISAGGKVQNCHTSFASGLPPEAEALCRGIEGAAVAPRPIGEAQITGKHVVIRSSLTIEEAAPAVRPTVN